MIIAIAVLLSIFVRSTVEFKHRQIMKISRCHGLAKPFVHQSHRFKTTGRDTKLKQCSNFNINFEESMEYRPSRTKCWSCSPLRHHTSYGACSVYCIENVSNSRYLQKCTLLSTVSFAVWVLPTRVVYFTRCDSTQNSDVKSTNVWK